MSEFMDGVDLINREEEQDVAKKFLESVDKFLDQDNEVRIVLVGSTINIIKQPIVRVKAQPRGWVETYSHVFLFGKKKRYRKSRAQPKENKDVAIQEMHRGIQEQNSAVAEGSGDESIVPIQMLPDAREIMSGLAIQP